MTARPHSPVFTSLPPMMSGMTIFSPAIASSRALSDARSGVPGAYERIGSLTGGGTRRRPLKAAKEEDIAFQFIAFDDRDAASRPSAPAPRSSFRSRAPHDLVEAPEQRLALGIRPGLIRARVDAGLQLLGHPPVLAVRAIPELHRVVDLRVAPRELVGME